MLNLFSSVTPDRQDLPPSIPNNFSKSSNDNTIFGSSNKDIVLSRMLTNLMDSVKATDDKHTPYRIFSQRTALTKQYIEINGLRKITYLVFDIDRPQGGVDWDDYHCPPPNLVTINKGNGHAHLIYELSDPVWISTKDQTTRLDKPVWWLECTRTTLRKTLRSDAAYNGLLTKNPFHPQWRVYSPRSKPYSLSELSEHLDITHPYKSRQERQSTGTGRHSQLFDGARFWAYEHKQDYTNFEDFRDDVRERVEEINRSFTTPKPYGDVRSTVKSISTWVWNRYHKGTKKRETLSQTEITRRQIEGGEQTRKNCEDQTLPKLRKAITYMVDHGLETNHTQIAKQSGLSRRTVIRHSETVASLIREAGYFKVDSQVTSTVMEGIPDAGGPLSHPYPTNDNATDQQTDPLTLKVRQALAKTTPSAPIISKVLKIARLDQPTYEQIRTDDDIKTTIIVLQHASEGRYVSGLPNRLQGPAIQRLKRFVANTYENENHNDHVSRTAM